MIILCFHFLIKFTFEEQCRLKIDGLWCIWDPQKVFCVPFYVWILWHTREGMVSMESMAAIMPPADYWDCTYKDAYESKNHDRPWKHPKTKFVLFSRKLCILKDVFIYVFYFITEE